MDNIIHINIEDKLSTDHKNEHEKYEYIKKTIVPRKSARQTVVAIYEIPPLKSAFPYHYHTKNEETYFIISGEGILKTIDGIKKVGKGDIIYFPANSNGAHKLTNTSNTQMLLYIDFDTNNDLEVTVYPDSNKIGIWGKDITQIHKIDSKVSYYENE